MSFNRLKYDRCNITKYNQESTGPGNYMTGTPIMCNTCFNDNPRIINQKEGNFTLEVNNYDFIKGKLIERIQSYKYIIDPNTRKAILKFRNYEF